MLAYMTDGNLGTKCAGQPSRLKPNMLQGACCKTGIDQDRLKGSHQNINNIGIHLQLEKITMMEVSEEVASHNMPQIAKG